MYRAITSGKTILAGHVAHMQANFQMDSLKGSLGLVDRII
jgi:hypothetical protein